MMETLSTGAIEQSQREGSFNFFSLYAIIGVIALAGVGIMLYVRKKNEEVPM